MPIPRKRFGQHFLRDQAVIERIVSALDPKSSDHLLEIGPGEGALTFPVLQRSQQLDVVEIDRDLIPILQSKAEHRGKLMVHAADALMFDFAKIKTDTRPLRVFGNLPYNISTPLIFHLLTFANTITDMLFMLQKEVAWRLAAAPSTADYGRLSVMAQYHCQIDLLFDVGPQAFYPPPKVQSSIIRLRPYQTLPHRALDDILFAALVKQAFGQRRKTLRNSLKELVNDEIWAKTKINPNSRAENLTVEDFVLLSNVIHHNKDRS